MMTVHINVEFNVALVKGKSTPSMCSITLVKVLVQVKKKTPGYALIKLFIILGQVGIIQS